MLTKLIDAGCDVIRINMSHSSQDEAAGIIADVRTISQQVGILLDTRVLKFDNRSRGYRESGER